MNIQEERQQTILQLENLSALNENKRTFVFEKQQTQQSRLLDIDIVIEDGHVDLYDLFEQYCPLKLNRVSIYDPETNRFTSLAKIGADLNGKIPAYLFQARVIMIRFKKAEEEGGNSESDSGLDSNYAQIREKKDRSKQRTIGQTIQIVRQWRAVHLSSLKAGMKKVSLQEAAKAVGVSKKSLDDYYYQLRLGEFYKFDFLNNLEQKVGILRAYVKEFKPEREVKNRNMRHPKNLKIIETLSDDGLPHVLNILKISLQPPPPKVQTFEEIKSPSSCKSLFDHEDSLQSFSNPFTKDLASSYEDRFFKNFEFLMDDPNDPFIEVDRDFKKKAFEEPGNDFFMF